MTKISITDGMQGCVLAGREFPPEPPATTAILVLNYQNLDDTVFLVHSLEASTSQDFDLYVIDNASEGLSPEEIARALPNAHVLRTAENLGYAGGNNAGLRLIETLPYEFVWILNPDMEVSSTALEQFVAAAADHPNHMIFGAAIEQGADPGKVNSAGSFCRFEKGLHVGNLHAGTQMKALPQAPFEADCLSGCSIFLRKAVLRDIGYLPEDYFLYFEETHWLMNATRKGYPGLVLPDIHLKHHQRTRASDLPPTYYFYYYLRGAMLFCRAMDVQDMEATLENLHAYFINPWLKRIACTHPERVSFYENLAGRALMDGRVGKVGPIDLSILEATLDTALSPAPATQALDPPMNSSPVAPTALIVLGMHRSGTSALAGTLALLGCDRPKTEITVAEDNAKGFFEARAIARLNEDILQSAGTTWDDWTPVNPDWLNSARADLFRAKAATLLQEEFGPSPLFVLKDPRLCRLMPFWSQILTGQGYQMRIVHTHRNPLEVAQSLESRNGITQDLGLLIWLRHVLDAEYASRGMSRHFTSYGQVLSNWAEMVQALQKELEITLPRVSAQSTREVEEFLSHDLRHFSEPVGRIQGNPVVPVWVQDTFAILERWTARGEDPADHASFDRIRAEMHSATPIFGQLINATQKASTVMRSRLAETEEKLAEVQDMLEAEQTRARDLNDTLSEVQSALTQRRHEAEDTARELQKSKAELNRVRTALIQEEQGRTQLILRMKYAQEKAGRAEQERDKARDAQKQAEEMTETARAETLALQETVSWRVTAPLRKISRMLKD